MGDLATDRGVSERWRPRDLQRARCNTHRGEHVEESDWPTLGTNGVGRLVMLRTVEILTPSCAVIATVAMDAFTEGGVIVINEGPTVETRPGGNPASGDDGQASEQCGLASPSP